MKKEWRLLDSRRETPAINHPEKRRLPKAPIHPKRHLSIPYSNTTHTHLSLKHLYLHMTYHLFSSAIELVSLHLSQLSIFLSPRAAIIVARPYSNTTVNLFYSRRDRFNMEI